MRVEIYVESEKDTDIWDRLDLYAEESINMEFKLKDSADLSRVYSTYSQEFSIPASPRNNRALNFFFDTNLLRDTGRYLKCRIYNNEQVFRNGIISVNNVNFIKGEPSSYNVNFNTGLTSLKDIIGNDTLNMLDFSDINIQWNPNSIASIIQQPYTENVIIPLISKSRLWSMTGSEHNINTGFIKTEELRPALRMRYLLNKIIKKYKLNIENNIPQQDWNYIWCNNKLSANNHKVQLDVNVPVTYNNGLDPSTYFTARINSAQKEFIVDYTGYDTGRQPFEMIVSLIEVKDLFSNQFYNGEIIATVVDENGKEYSTAYTPTLAGNYYIKIPVGFVKERMTKRFKIYISSKDIITMKGASYIHSLLNLIHGGRYNATSGSNITATMGDNFNFNYAIGEIKTIDFLTSLFKMYNIKVIESKVSDKLIFDSSSKTEFSGLGMDLTSYVQWDNVKISPPVNYQELIFTHKESDFFRNTEYKKLVNKEFGSEVYNSKSAYLSEDYEVETDFQVMDWFKINGGSPIMTYGFSEPNKPVEDTDSIVLIQMSVDNNQPVLDDAGNPKPIYVGTSQTNRVPIRSYTPCASSDDWASITFDININPYTGVPQTGSLYNRYYSFYIERLYNYNTRIYTYDMVLTPDIINEFDATRRVTIGNMLYSVEECTIDMVTGKTKIKLMNYTTGSVERF